METKGAEPIYLHIIRPFLKPYTSAVDQLLDFTRVVGDVVLGLAALPFLYITEWWQRRFGTEPECLDTETEASSSPLSPVSTSDSRPPVSRTNTSKLVTGSGGSIAEQRQPTRKRSSLLTDQNKGQVGRIPTFSFLSS
jgi:hypothetical protein